MSKPDQDVIENNLTGLIKQSHSTLARKPIVRNDAGNPLLNLSLLGIDFIPDGPDFKFLRDDPVFQSYVRRNLWETRTERGYKSHTDCIQFIQEVYGPWLGKGLLRSDLLYLDKPLYVQFQRQLSRLKKVSMVPDWIETQLPKQRSDEAIKQVIDRGRSEEERIAYRFLRERQRANRKPK